MMGARSNGRDHVPRFRIPGAQAPAWVILETGTTAVLSLFSLLLIGRVIGPHAAGVGTVALSAFLLIDLAASSLFPDSLVQRPRLEQDHVDGALTAHLLAGLGGGLLLVGLAPLLSLGAGSGEEVRDIALALAPLLPFSAVSGACSGLLLRQRRNRLLAMRAIVGHPIGLTAGLAAAQLGAGAWAMFVQQAVATAITFSLLAWRLRIAYRPRIRLAALADLWPVAGPQVLSILVLAGRYRIFVVALGMLVAEALVAVSHIAFRLVDSVLAVAWGSMARLSIQRLSVLQHDRAALAEAYGDLAQLQALMGMPIAAGVALTAGDLVQGLLGPAWQGAADAARIAGLAAVVGFAYGDTGGLFVALGRTRINLAVALVQLGAPLTLLLMLRPETASGVALCWAATTVAIAPPLARLALRHLGRSPLWLARRIAPGVLATAAMAAAVLALETRLSAPPLLRMAAAAAIGATVFALVAWLALGRRLPRALLAAGPPPHGSPSPAPVLAPG
jgi:O-antigen/teichoic acid export membrane protein